MNDARRKQIDSLIASMRDLTDLVETLQAGIQDVLDEEQEYLDNMPENMQQSERASIAEEAISALEEAASAADDIVGNLQTIEDALENAKSGG